ncbi:hypothetical protein [Bacillus sp. RO1]|uniref:hypothetical protein n=1 Tax=Bacillus sp. RO1 TaxID=2722703 RepID=UPI0014578BF5|nr:hypothetical protein [Bacillus sp. RO1]NLP50217.1 hypothetical protein [Bacillus sp. RO1]
MQTKDQLINSFSEIDMKEYTMPIICIYNSPTDYKGMFVARLFDVNKPTPVILMRLTLDAIRKEIPESFSLVPKQAGEDANIVETYI